jgi:anti-sigma regulatory factor (Ser/Thr protein kinase)
MESKLMEDNANISDLFKCDFNNCFLWKLFNYPIFMGKYDTEKKDFISIKINSSLPTLLSYKKNHFAGKPILPKKIWYDKNERKIFINNVLKAKELKDYIVRLKSKDGKDFYGCIQVKIKKVNGVLFISGFCNDITVRLILFEKLEKKTYELMEKNNIISFSAKTIVHEISNYIMPIINYSETSILKVYSGKYSNEEIIEMLQNYIKISNNIIKFNKKWSDLLKESEQTHSSNMGKFNLLNLIKVVAGINSLALLDKGVQLQYEVTPYTVVGIKDDIKIVLMNLIGNAIKYSPIGKTIIIKTSEIDNKTIRIDVINKGQMPAEKIKNLFTPYNNQQDINTTTIDGQGLGLCISKKIIKQHNNKMGVEKIDAENVSFYFTMERWKYNDKK